jgi:hypothetical protein
MVAVEVMEGNKPSELKQGHAWLYALSKIHTFDKIWRPAACGRKMMPILCSQMWPDRFRVITHIQHPDILTFYDLRPRTKPAHRSP